MRRRNDSGPQPPNTCIEFDQLARWFEEGLGDSLAITCIGAAKLDSVDAEGDFERLPLLARIPLAWAQHGGLGLAEDVFGA